MLAPSAAICRALERSSDSAAGCSAFVTNTQSRQLSDFYRGSHHPGTAHWQVPAKYFCRPVSRAAWCCSRHSWRVALRWLLLRSLPEYTGRCLDDFIAACALDHECSDDVEESSAAFNGAA